MDAFPPSLPEPPPTGRGGDSGTSMGSCSERRLSLPGITRRAFFITQPSEETCGRLCKWRWFWLGVSSNTYHGYTTIAGRPEPENTTHSAEPGEAGPRG